MSDATRRLFRKALCILMALVVATPVFAAPQPPPQGFIDTWRALRTAVLLNNVDKAGSLVRFPLHSTDAGHRDIRTRPEFRRRFTELFEPIVMELIRTNRCETVKGEHGYEVDCGNGYMIFGFEQHHGSYLMTSFGSINE